MKASPEELENEPSTAGFGVEQGVGDVTRSTGAGSTIITTQTLSSAPQVCDDVSVQPET